jgi:tetratricopeptide (TPR) repeat protein
VPSDGGLLESPKTQIDAHAMVPSVAGRFSPSQARVEGELATDGKWLSDADSCDGCHADAVAMWKSSAHAFASFNNPIYRASVERFRAEAGNEASRHCGSCHDPSLLVSGAMDSAIDPGDWRAHAGVTCKTCHSITETRPDGNGSYTLTAAPIPIPKKDDPESVRKHKERLTPKPLRDSMSLCATCHRAFLGHETGNAAFFAGADDVTPWQRSAYAGSRAQRIDDVEEKDCRGCHMAREAAPLGDVSAKNGTIASHRFLGGHTWLAAMRGDRATMEREQAQMSAAVSIDVAVATAADGTRTLPADGAPVTRGSRMLLDVVVRNMGVGHRFPGGTLDAQDAWIEVLVEDAQGHFVAAQGIAPDAQSEDPESHRLRALVIDEKATPRLERDVNHFRTAVVNHTLLPRDAEVVQYALDVPKGLSDAALPLRVTARLRHRSRNLALQKVACEAAKGPRGLEFRGRTPLDPCAAQPVTEVAKSVVYLGADKPGEGGAAAPAYKRLLDHGYGMTHAVQERLEEARPSLEKALALVGEAGPPRDRARILEALGALSAHESRTEESLSLLNRAAALAPNEPSIDAHRGHAFAEVWRWADSIEPLRRAANAAPRDDSAWSMLAVALSSRGGADAESLEAARRTLELSPRDPDGLRVVWLSLGSLNARPEEVNRARDAYEAFRLPDDVPSIKGRCSKTVPGCALERNPVHVHVLQP